MKSIHLRIHGRVQGVFFRQHTVEQALNFSLCGFVRNCPDGTVEIEVQGKEEQVDRFIDWCRQGPTKAKVRQLDMHDIPLKNFTEFRIL